MSLRRVVALWLSAGALLPTPAHAQPPRSTAPADLVLLDGRVFTARPDAPWAEAIAIRGDRIVRVGTTREIRRLAGARTRIVALGGRTVIPGINDAHDHLGPSFGTPVTTAPGPESDPPLALAVDSLRAVARRTPRGTWLSTAIGMRATDDTVGRLAALDAALPDHPVLLRAPWGHVTIANSAALRAMGITAASRDPLGGWYGATRPGSRTGRCSRTRRWCTCGGWTPRCPTARAPPRCAPTRRRPCASASRRCRRWGAGMSAAHTVRALRAARMPLRVRVVEWPVAGASGRDLREWAAAPRTVSPLVRVSGRKYMLDGTPLERLALQRRAYADRPGWRGRLNYPVDTVRAMLAEALRSPEQLMLHAVGDSTLRVVFGLMQSLAPDSRGRRGACASSTASSWAASCCRRPSGWVWCWCRTPRTSCWRRGWCRPATARCRPTSSGCATSPSSRVRLALGSDGSAQPVPERAVRDPARQRSGAGADARAGHHRLHGRLGVRGTRGA
jgi:hypothetical protein